MHSGIPLTLIPLDATNTIPVSENFFRALEKNQNTYDAQYCFQSLKMGRDTWFNDEFYKNYFLWDSFMAGVTISIMCKSRSNHEENEFAKMEYMNISVVTANEPYGISDGSNPFFDGRAIPMYNMQKNGVQMWPCAVGNARSSNGKGRCVASAFVDGDI
ncbi:unnamed protein product [Ilex paraguariensis]|uniref:Uncharacterized protein n=1 Tax=Ilex paraguariensis TaxID=185542 RepID=A0ABC8QNC1_9AQUA